MPSLNLPEQFSALDRFAAWILPDATERMIKRSSSNMTEIREFYDGIMPMMAELLTYLAAIPCEDRITTEDQNLLQLTFSLGEIGPAVEWFNSPLPADAFDVRRFTYLKEF